MHSKLISTAVMESACWLIAVFFIRPLSLGFHLKMLPCFTAIYVVKSGSH